VKLHRKIAARIKRGPERTRDNPKGRWRNINGRGDDQPYIVRYYLFECRFFDIYIHEIKRSDDSPDYHDHPWPFVHVILEGEYIEEAPWEAVKSRIVKRVRRRTPGYIAFRKANYAHRLELDKGDAWTLVMSGPRSRKWGFVDRVTGCWTHWKAYVQGERC